MPSSDERTPLNPGDDSTQKHPPSGRSNNVDVLSELVGVLRAYSFLVLIAAAITLAYVYPPLGAVYLVPSITSNWMCVVFIFLMAGMSMRSEELLKAFDSLPFNAFVQCYNFLAVSLLVFGFVRLVDCLGMPMQGDLADAMMICACMPITVTMVIVMTKSADGDGAAAVFNAALGSLLGVFVSPALIIRYTGLSGSVDLNAVFVKLSLKVILPIAIGQMLHFSKMVSEFVHDQKRHFKRLQEYTLVFIVYTVFCRTFLDASESKDPLSGSTVSIFDVLYMGFSQLVLLNLSMLGAWVCLRTLFSHDIRLCIMGLFGSTQKSVVMGIPLINALFEHSPNAALYTLPLLIWHPLQLILGSALAPRLAEMAEREDESRLASDASAGLDESRRASQVERRASKIALQRVSLVAWESTVDMKELLDETEEEIS